MTIILRWHISRIYDERRLKEDLPFDTKVTITPMAKSNSYTPEDLANIDEEDIDVWESDDEKTIIGWVKKENILNALIEKTYLKDSLKVRFSPSERRITEDMVFIQFIYDEEALHNIKEEKWKDMLILNNYIQIENSKWLDFTLQAREMAKTLYKNLLESSKEGSYEKK